MASYGPHYTSRLRVKYAGGGHNHNSLLRFPGPASGSGVTDLTAAFQSFLTALEPLLYDDFAVLALSVADINTTVFLPIANTITVNGGVSAATRLPIEEATEWSFVARTTGGNPWKFGLFGLYENGIEAGPGQNFRINFGENGDMDSAMTVLNANGTAFVGNDGAPLHWYPYVDYGTNAHWKKKVRS